MATSGHPGLVWLGAAGAFMVHVAIAVTVGVAVFSVQPARALDATVTRIFAASAVYAWHGRAEEGPSTARAVAPSRRGALAPWRRGVVASWLHRSSSSPSPSGVS